MPQNCINEAVHLLAAGVINTALSFIIVLLPIRTVIALHLPTKQQLIVYILFAGGLFTCAAGVVRTYVTWIMTTNADISWDAHRVILTGSLELLVGIVWLTVSYRKSDKQTNIFLPDLRVPSGG